MRLLLDRPLPEAVATRLRAVGHDVVAAAERPELALDDAGLFRAAADEGRALVTGNVGDFLPLAEDALARGERHPGLVLAPPPRYPRTPLAVGRLVRDLDGLLGSRAPEAGLDEGIAWLEPPPGCPFHPPAGPRRT
jgi:hypothetical protein